MGQFSMEISASAGSLLGGNQHLAPLDEEALARHVAEADLILDASASVPVARWASDLPGEARRMCAFFTPDGKSAVLMIEDEARSMTLRDLEALYLRELLQNPALADHLGPVERMQYTGACRALTNRIPMSSIQVLSGLIAAGLSSGIHTASAVVKIWTMDDAGVKTTVVSGASSTLRRDGWNVVLPVALSDELARHRTWALPSETGGPLMGMIDLDHRRIDVIGALRPPTDSLGTPTSFTRGTTRLKADIVAAAARTGNQIRYVGEWHSHPRGRSSLPSRTDFEQIAQLGTAMEIDGLPAVSLIVAENEMSVLVGGAGSF